MRAELPDEDMAGRMSFNEGRVPGDWENPGRTVRVKKRKKVIFFMSF